MKNSSITLIALIATVVITLIIIRAQSTNDFKSKSLNEKRSEILSEIDTTLIEAEKLGKYDCCMQPPCKMCLLGNWIWKDGTCKCDDMINQGELDKVCPECKRSLKEGNGGCPIG